MHIKLLLCEVDHLLECMSTLYFKSWQCNIFYILFRGLEQKGKTPVDYQDEDSNDLDINTTQEMIFLLNQIPNIQVYTSSFAELKPFVKPYEIALMGSDTNIDYL